MQVTPQLISQFGLDPAFTYAFDRPHIDVSRKRLVVVADILNLGPQFLPPLTSPIYSGSAVFRFPLDTPLIDLQFPYSVFHSSGRGVTATAAQQQQQYIFGFFETEDPLERFVFRWHDDDVNFDADFSSTVFWDVFNLTTGSNFNCSVTGQPVNWCDGASSAPRSGAVISDDDVVFTWHSPGGKISTRPKPYTMLFQVLYDQAFGTVEYSAVALRSQSGANVYVNPGVASDANGNVMFSFYTHNAAFAVAQTIAQYNPNPNPALSPGLSDSRSPSDINGLLEHPNRYGDTLRLRPAVWQHASGRAMIVSGYLLKGPCPLPVDESCANVENLMWIMGKLTSVRLLVVDSGTGLPPVSPDCTTVTLQHVEAPWDDPSVHSAGDTKSYLAGQYTVHFAQTGCEVTSTETDNPSVFVDYTLDVPKLMINASDTEATVTLRLQVRSFLLMFRGAGFTFDAASVI